LTQSDHLVAKEDLIYAFQEAILYYKMARYKLLYIAISMELKEKEQKKLLNQAKIELHEMT